MDMSLTSINIGASAGGFHVLQNIVSKFPADLPVPVFVVMHVAASQPSQLPAILSSAGPLLAIHPKDGTPIQSSVIYVAPPDHHILVDGGSVAVRRGPKENGFRPSIDALFRSAGYAYGPGAIGVVLSGALNDGTSGLWTIKRLGGTAVVQDPYEAEYPSMPRSALEYVEADYQLRTAEIGGLLTQLAHEQVAQEMGVGNDIEHDLEKRIAKEVQIAAGSDISKNSILELGDLTPFTCPECHGALVRILDGNFARYRCHTGHAYSEDALLEHVMKVSGELIWQAARGLQETEMLLEHMAQHIKDKESGNPEQAEKFLAKAYELRRKAVYFQELARGHESLSVEKLENQQSEEQE